MSHPFELDPAELEAMELDFEEQLTDEETAQVSGGRHATIVCISAPCPGSEGGGDDPDYLSSVTLGRRIIKIIPKIDQVT